MGQGTGLRLFVRHANGLGACFAPSLPRKLGSCPAFSHERRWIAGALASTLRQTERAASADFKLP
jgi:hypothetical protein